MESKSAEKKIERISKQQKHKLIDYMSSNLEFARGQFGGINSNCRYKEQWESLRVSLNSLGGSEKSVDQWKKCWIDLKSGVKKTINARRKFMNKTGGGSWADAPRDLSSQEEQILQIMTAGAVDGDSCTPESGVKLEESVEDFESVEYLECDKMCAPPAKKALLQPTSSNSLQLPKRPPSPTPKPSSSKYVDALDEARRMQKDVVDQLNRIEKQNKEILEKLDKLLGANTTLS